MRSANYGNLFYLCFTQNPNFFGGIGVVQTFNPQTYMDSYVFRICPALADWTLIQVTH